MEPAEIDLLAAIKRNAKQDKKNWDKIIPNAKKKTEIVVKKMTARICCFVSVFIPFSLSLFVLKWRSLLLIDSFSSSSFSSSRHFSLFCSFVMIKYQTQTKDQLFLRVVLFFRDDQEQVLSPHQVSHLLFQSFPSFLL